MNCGTDTRAILTHRPRSRDQSGRHQSAAVSGVRDPGDLGVERDERAVQPVHLELDRANPAARIIPARSRSHEQPSKVQAHRRRSTRCRVCVGYRPGQPRARRTGTCRPGEGSAGPRPARERDRSRCTAPAERSRSRRCRRRDRSARRPARIGRAAPRSSAARRNLRCMGRFGSIAINVVPGDRYARLAPTPEPSSTTESARGRMRPHLAVDRPDAGLAAWGDYFAGHSAGVLYEAEAAEWRTSAEHATAGQHSFLWAFG